MGSRSKERLCAPDSRLLGMFVKFPMMETIERPEAVEDIERILDIPGVDAGFIGQSDLTQTLGDRAAAQKLVDRALAACVARGIPACTTAYGDDVSSRLDQGFKWLAVAADTGLFTTAVKQRLATARRSST